MSRLVSVKYITLFFLISSVQLVSFIVSARGSDVNSAHKTINGSASTGHPHPQFFYPQTHPHHTNDADGRDPRQWMSSYGYGSPYLGLGMFGGTEILIVSVSRATRCSPVALGINHLYLSPLPL